MNPEASTNAVLTAVESGKITFEQAWAYGGHLMWVLAGFSVLALATMLYLLVAQRRGRLVRISLRRLALANDPAAEGARIAERVYSAVDWLADIASIAPLVGLLGTVLGIFEAFSLVNTDLDQVSKVQALTQGVSKAVVTTIFGLVIAVPSLLAHAYFRRRAAKSLAKLEEKAEGQKGPADALRA